MRLCEVPDDEVQDSDCVLEVEEVLEEASSSPSVLDCSSGMWRVAWWETEREGGNVRFVTLTELDM